MPTAHRGERGHPAVSLLSAGNGLLVEADGLRGSPQARVGVRQRPGNDGRILVITVLLLEESRGALRIRASQAPERPSPG